MNKDSKSKREVSKCCETKNKFMTHELHHCEKCWHINSATPYSKDYCNDENCPCHKAPFIPAPIQEEEWEKIKTLLYEMDEMEFAASRDQLFKDVDRLLASAITKSREETKEKISAMKSDCKTYHNKWLNSPDRIYGFNFAIEQIIKFLD